MQDLTTRHDGKKTSQNAKLFASSPSARRIWRVLIIVPLATYIHSPQFCIVNWVADVAHFRIITRCMYIRILGIDYGDRRTGVAVSDPFGWTAQGLEVIIGGMKTVVNRVAELSAVYDADEVVVGYPLNMDGSAGSRARITDDFIYELLLMVRCPVSRWDERLTSVYAERTMHETGSAATRNKGEIDILSAVILLQSYLDRAAHQ